MKTSVKAAAILFLIFCGSNVNAKSSEGTLAKFEPAGDKVLVFIGQDNKSVGGTDKWNDGYVDNIGVPAGITHYVYFTEGKSNPYGFEFDTGSVDGLNKETTWGAGPMCMACYMESEKLADTLIHLSISMEHDDETEVASGKHDHLIKELTAFLKQHANRAFYLRIGYEFDGSWNHYEPEAFKVAWRRIVDNLRAEGINNFATVLASSRHHLKRETWEAYWPGDDYVDWLGYSFWHNETPHPVVFDIAREKNKPVFIAEITPRGFWLNKTSGDLIWFDWFQILFDHIEANADVIKAISFINANWDADPMWKGRGWGDSRIQINNKLKKRWLDKMAEDRYIHSTDAVNELIRFNGNKG